MFCELCDQLGCEQLFFLGDVVRIMFNSRDHVAPVDGRLGWLWPIDDSILNSVGVTMTQNKKVGGGVAGWLVCFGGFIAVSVVAGFFISLGVFGYPLALLVAAAFLALIFKRDWRSQVFGSVDLLDNRQQLVLLWIGVCFMLSVVIGAPPEDRDFPPQSNVNVGLDVSADQIPSYQVIRQMHRPATGPHADILVSSFSRSTPVAEQTRVAKAIAGKENVTTLNLYSTKDGFQAMDSAAYRQANPGADQGYLGSWGVVPGTYTDASSYDFDQ